MKINAWITLAFYLFFLGGCSDSSRSIAEEDIVCTTEFVPGISVKVFDDKTGLPISCGASIIIGDGSFVETVTKVNASDINGCVNSGSLQGAFERPGMYSLVVSKMGYLDYVVTDIEVGSNKCHVITVDIKANLTK